MVLNKLFCLATAFCATAACASEWVLPAGSSAAGLRPPQLAAQWWQWAMSAPDEHNPVTDGDGSDCATGQQGPVWFLAGGFGSSKVRRTCRVPAGKHLFFPVINMVYWRKPDTAEITCAQARRLAALNNDTAIDLFAELDGVVVSDIKQHRVSSDPCFEVFERLPAQDRPYKAYPAATDGYWLMVRPLPKGIHVLKFGGRYNRESRAYGRMLQDIEYELLVQ